MPGNGDYREEFKGRKVGILGIARSGVAAAKVLQALGASVFLSDRRSEQDLLPFLSELKGLSVEIETGKNTPALYRGRDLVVSSPGVPFQHPLLKEAREVGVPVIGELELAYRISQSPIVAVTGTNGKSTTTSLIHHILEKAGRPAVLGGNIGIPLVGQVFDIGEGSWVVTEVSSFQLETIQFFRPRASVLLNITTDHLDRHGKFGEYVAMKSRIFMNQRNSDIAVLNADDPAVMSLRPLIRTRILFFSRKDEVPQGAFSRGGELVLRQGTEDLSLGRWEESGLRGFHNLENVLAAACVCSWCGVPPEAIFGALKSYEVMRHRLEYSGEVRGIRFYDDSKGTNPGAVKAALESFSEPIILIAGGKDKDMDFGELGRSIRKHAKALVTIGETAEKIAEAARKAGMCTIAPAGSLKEALDLAYHLAVPGDVVLLSPACASFDMFRNAEERGDLFQAAVRDLKKKEEGK